VTMSRKSSIPQDPKSVSVALMPDIWFNNYWRDFRIGTCRVQRC